MPHDPSETQRLAVLHRLAILDTDAEPAFDGLVKLAQGVFGVATAVVSLVDQDRQWFKARVGLDCAETPRGIAFCHYAIQQPQDVFVVHDASQDPRFAQNPLVTGDPHIRFYAGMPLIVDGAAVGTLCLIDPNPRPDFGPAEQAKLAALAEPVKALLQVRLENRARRMLARSLDYQARKLSMAEQLAGVGHWSLDITSGEIVWSDEVYRIHGLDRESFNPNLSDGLTFYLEPWRTRVAEYVDRAVASRSGFDFKAQLRRVSDGSVRTVASRGEYRTAEDGRDTLFGVFQDVTEQEDLLRQVTEDRERYKLLTDNANDMIASMSLDSTIRSVTPACARVLGYTPLELLGRRTLDLTHPDDVPAVKAMFATLIAAGPDGRLPPYRFRALAKSGDWVWLEGQPRILFDANGDPTLIQDVTRDVTARKVLEDELAEARDRAEAGARAKADFLANMSHELRTPLTGILGYTDVLLGRELDAESRRCAALIGQAGRNLLLLVNDVLDLSKFEAGGLSLHPEPVDVVDLVRSSAALLRKQVDAKGLTLAIDAPDRTLMLEVDPGRLRQVLLNLISNAVKFTTAGEVRVSLTADPAGAGRQAVRIAVQDTGIGISDDGLKRIFDRFEQADGSITRRFGGTGLGLSISRAIAELMGGDLTAHSRQGQGSTFDFTFEAAEARLPVAADAVEEAQGPSLSGLRILVAEDVALNRELIRIFLGPHGPVLTEVANGAEALEAASKGTFDLIVMDMQMPVMDGLEATRRIRAGGGPSANVPILALTANVMAEQKDICREAGMDSHLGKPFSAASLAQAVSAAVSRSRMPAAA